MYYQVKKIVSIAWLTVALAACRHTDKDEMSAVDIIHQEQDELTQVIIYDVFTPPVASRIYAYTSLAAYEAIRYSKPGEPSLAEHMNGFGKMPEPVKGEKYDFALAAAQAFFMTSHKVVFSTDSLKHFEYKIYKQFSASLDEDVYKRSIAFGDTIAAAIWKRGKDDNYIKSRGKPKYLGSNEPGKWRPTQPDYFDGVEFCWNEMKPLLLDSASQFDPSAPPPYSTDTNSLFFQQVLEVHRVNKNLTEEQYTIAKFWDDNPFVMEHSGHLAFANKKITPGGHWMGIAAIAARLTTADAVKTAKTYAITAAALYDAFISCWNVKYKWNYIRPVTVINDLIEKTWSPLLQTPPFPEYSSGHSTISGAASTVLTSLYGDDFVFHDNSDSAYIGMTRDFPSFDKAAEEVSVSRLYGGIHYRLSLDTGLKKGRQLGDFIVRKLKL